METENQSNTQKETTGNLQNSFTGLGMMWRFEVKDMDNNWEYARQFSERNIGDVINEFCLFIKGCGYDCSESFIVKGRRNDN